MYILHEQSMTSRHCNGQSKLTCRMGEIFRRKEIIGALLEEEDHMGNNNNNNTPWGSNGDSAGQKIQEESGC